MFGKNPVLYADYPDPDVILVGDTYYMISTAMHMFPGGQILRSFDMMHWEHCAYVYDMLGETARQRMDEGHIYGKGMWAGCIRYHGGCFHVVFTSNDTQHSYHYTAEKAEGPWVRQPMEGFWYDPSVLFDDDGRVYIAHGNRTVRITELTGDLSAALPGGLDRVALQDSQEIMLGWEGSHLLHIGEWYYLFSIHWRRGGKRAMGCARARKLTDEFVGGEFMELSLAPREDGVAQGGPIQLADGSWALLLFQDHGAIGRLPVVVPFTWHKGWPVVTQVPEVLDLPSFRPEYAYAPLVTDDFASPLWQCNHEPHPELMVRTAERLTLTSDRLAMDCTQAVNTLSQRCFGPKMAAEVTVSGAGMHEGDHAGLCALMGCYAQLGLTKTAEGFALSLQTKAAQAEESQQVQYALPSDTVRIRADFDFDRDEVAFSCLMGETWTAVGQAHRLVYRLDHFMGCRAGLYLHSTKEPGGTACFRDFRYMQG